MSKEVNHVDNMTIISFKNELGQLHRERGRPARIAHRNDGISCFEYYVNGTLFRPRKKGRDQPNTVVIGDNTGKYVFRNNIEPNTELPHLVNLYPDGSYDIYYTNLFIYGNDEFKYVENIDGQFIVGYSLNFGGSSAFILDNTRQRINVPPERAKSGIPNIPRATITTTPLSHFEPFY
jgi:hypothetical protein